MWQPGTFRATFTDGREPLELRVSPRALVEVERKWPGRKPDGSDSPPAIEALYYSVWVANGRPGKFEAYIDALDGVELVSGDEPDPTEPTPGDE